LALTIYENNLMYLNIVYIVQTNWLYQNLLLIYAQFLLIAEH